MAGTPERVPSLARLRRQYPTEAACRHLLEELRWPQGPFCPHCGSYALWAINGNSCRAGLKECRDCRRQYTVTTKTPMHATQLPLWTWIQAMYLVVTSSKGISSMVMSRFLGVTQATAWRLGHAIREMMHDRDGPPLSGIVEIDLKYLGGAPKRRKDGQKSKRGKGTSKPRVLIAVQRDDRMRAIVVATEKTHDIQAALTGVVAQPGGGLQRQGSDLPERHQGLWHGASDCRAQRQGVRPRRGPQQHCRRHWLDARASQNGRVAPDEPPTPSALLGRDRLSLELPGEARIRQERPKAANHLNHSANRHVFQVAAAGDQPTDSAYAELWVRRLAQCSS